MPYTDPSRAVAPLQIPDEARKRIRVLFLAKHALWGGGQHPEDGNHAIYHHEVRSSLESLNLNLQIADKVRALYEKPEADFVFPLLNRIGFMNSEMMIPLLCNMHGIPYVGGSPIIRGLGDDKDLSKLVAQNADVPTAPWACYRRGAPVQEPDCPKAERWVIKPNASSASWGISDAYNWPDVANAVADIHAQGHDAIVEPYLDGYDVQVPFISVGGPAMLPMLIYEREDTSRLWTYYEKRDLVPNTEKSTLKVFDDPEWAPKVAELANRVARRFEPFDFGRLEFRLDRNAGEINFIEINLNCNLWSEKVIGKAASYAGFTHPQLMETILADSMRRNGLISL
ncbi:hypothetical protein PUV54_14035 [Hyphococcus flavus]|uniref:ATP-grasp domain-containing protein n=1 Tax=Hyphococcus flavus TaxID=1866326 RepID=A0AAE9ZHQ5_9PROT|nr:hypothetical protein [Hyphococcus flavus]WDI31071.1 hypothetical protein PUV54_14035 [Hyphococcus flavus]